METGDTSAAASAVSGNAIELAFGIYQTDKPSEMYRKFSPITDALGAAASRHLGQDVRVQLVILPTYERGIEAIVAGEVDFSRLGPAPYIMARESNPELELLAMELKKGKRRFKGVIAVRSDSPYRRVADLRGCRFAFGNKNSTIGRFLVQDILVSEGIRADALGAFEYLGRHDIVAKGIEIGDFDAGSLKIGTFKKVNKHGKLRILRDFDNVTKPWVARSDLPPETLDALRAALLGMSDEGALRALKVSGFDRGADSEYDFIREAMERSRTFEIRDSR